ncbi:MAG: FlgO family outer membrane protein [Methylobacter sp.]
MLKKATIFIPALLIASLNGCTSNRYHETKDADLVEVSYDATCELKDKLTRTLPKNSLVVVSTLLNVDDLSKTSSFGRIISDQIASAFHNSGYQIIGMEMPIDLFVMQEKGALHLSDETKAMLKPYQPAVIVGGVYAPGKKNAYVSLRIVDLHSKNIISSTDFSVPMGPDAKVLLESKEVGSAGSRSGSPIEGATPAVEEVAPTVEPELPAGNVQ